MTWENKSVPFSEVTTANRPKPSARTYTWAIALGLVGFICGYFGALKLLADPGGAAPVLGFFTGPLGLLVGALFGMWSTRFNLSSKQNLVFFIIAMIAVAVGTLYLAVSEYKETIRLVDAEIIGCEKVDRLLASQTKMWSEVVVRPTKIGSARPNWQQEISDMLLAQPGVVLTIRIHQEAWVREQQWRWGGISKRVDAWRSIYETTKAFAAITDSEPISPCERFVLGERRFSALVWKKSNDTPPANLPSFLELFVIQDIPPEYVRYIPKTK